MRLKKMCNQTTNALHKKWQVDNEGYDLFTDYLEAKDYNNYYYNTKAEATDELPLLYK